MELSHYRILLLTNFQSILTTMPEVHFFAAARAATGVHSAQLGATNLAELIQELSGAYPKLAPILPSCSYLLDGVACKNVDAAISTSSKIDVLPRFAGG
jgi:molybdopterin converting factor small subunit